jgi:hypothetical protein
MLILISDGRWLAEQIQDVGGRPATIDQRQFGWGLDLVIHRLVILKN